MKRIVFHIGMPKTGTTAVQSRLSSLRNELKDTGIIFPNFLEGMFGHHHLSLLLINQKDVWRELQGKNAEYEGLKSAYLEAFSKNVDEFLNSDGHTLLFSSEALFHQPSSEAIALSHLEGKGLEVEFIAFVREPKSHTASLYLELCKRYAEPVPFTINSPGPILRSFEQLPASRLTVIPYKNDTSFDCVEKILEHLGAKTSFRNVERGRVEQSISPEAMYLFQRTMLERYRKSVWKLERRDYEYLKEIRSVESCIIQHRMMPISLSRGVLNAIERINSLEGWMEYSIIKAPTSASFEDQSYPYLYNKTSLMNFFEFDHGYRIHLERHLHGKHFL